MWITKTELQRRLGHTYRDGFWDGLEDNPFGSVYWFSEISREAAGDLVNGDRWSRGRRIRETQHVCHCPDELQPMYEI